MIDYKEINDNLEIDKVIDLMKQLGVNNYIEKETHIIFPTICHNENADEASMKLYFYKDTKLFVCYTECGSLSIFNFLKHYYETRQIEYDWFQDILNVIKKCSIEKGFSENKISKYTSIRADYENKKTRKELITYPEGVLKIFQKYYPVEWLEDGITKEAMDKFNILFSSPRNKIIIPHYDVNSRLVGIRGRALNEWEIENLGKYMPVQIEDQWYSHPLSLNLYGLNITKNTMRANGICYLFEAEKSVMQMHNFNMANCSAAVCGSRLNKYQLDLLMRTCAPKEVILCFDKEEKKGESEYFNKLWKMCKKYEAYANFSFIYDRENLLSLKESPTDKGEEIFKKLLEKRVKVK